ncbi:hypothetical protein DFJ73DRAFT_469974 [Zopfochytrium polystomum]|nr:hypothetical protein DFJ73DRAFT_469974 [Zopfochytrium polystomum]
MMIAVPSDPDDLSAGDASLATVIPPLPEETGRPDSNATSLPSFRRDFRQALICEPLVLFPTKNLPSLILNTDKNTVVAAASVNGAPAGPPTAPPTGKPDTVAAVRRDFRQAIIYYAAATVDGGIYTHAAPATLSRPATQRFIFEIVKRSRATFYDLQLALFCFVRLRNAHAASTASTATTSPTAKESLVPPTAATNSDLSSPPSPPTSPFAHRPSHPHPHHPRTDETHLHFLGALIISHKYLHDARVDRDRGSPVGLGRRRRAVRSTRLSFMTTYASCFQSDSTRFASIFSHSQVLAQGRHAASNRHDMAAASEHNEA